MQNIRIPKIGTWSQSFSIRFSELHPWILRSSHQSRLICTLWRWYWHCRQNSSEIDQKSTSSLPISQGRWPSAQCSQTPFRSTKRRLHRAHKYNQPGDQHHRNKISLSSWRKSKFQRWRSKFNTTLDFSILTEAKNPGWRNDFLRSSNYL